MIDYRKLLLNIEENIFYQLQKRATNNVTKKKYDSKINDMILIQLACNDEIIEFYKSKFHIIPIDIDIINLIIKYIDVCIKIVKIEMIDLLGIKEINYHPKNTLISLDSDYILSKYPPNKKYGWGIDASVIKNFHIIFLNIIIPYAIKEINLIYWST